MASPSTSSAASLYHVHHLMWEVNAQMGPISDEFFEDTELTLPLAGTLDSIALAPGVTVAEISRAQPKTPQAVSQLVAKLEKLGLVERRLGSGRGVGLYLTERGETAHADGTAREERIEARLREMLGADLYEELRLALEKARPALSDTDTTQILKVSDAPCAPTPSASSPRPSTRSPSPRPASTSSSGPAT